MELTRENVVEEATKLFNDVVSGVMGTTDVTKIHTIVYNHLNKKYRLGKFIEQYRKEHPDESIDFGDLEIKCRSYIEEYHDYKKKYSWSDETQYSLIKFLQYVSGYEFVSSLLEIIVQ